MNTNRDKYKRAFGVLHTSCEFQMEAKEMRTPRRLRTNRFATTFAAAALVLVMGTGVVFAASHWLTPSEVAHEIGDSKLEAAFESEDAVLLNETQSFEKYDVTLLGMISGKDLSTQKVEAAYNKEPEDSQFDDDKTYVVTVIERKDGGEIGEGESFFTSPLIDGYSPSEANIAIFRGGYASVYSDDMKTEYSIVDMGNIEPFADHKIHIAVQDGGFFEEGSNGEPAFTYDEKTGKYSPNEKYEGVNALFDLPIDESKADPAKAKELLEQPYEVQEESASSVSDKEADAWADGLTPENINEKAVPVEKTKVTITPDKDGLVRTEVSLPSGYTSETVTDMDSLFPDGKTGMSSSFSYAQEDDDIYVDVYVLNADGTVTYELYQKK